MTTPAASPASTSPPNATSSASATDWTMNTAGLQKGMVIRRPGRKEELPVLDVKRGQAKIKTPEGPITISASAEVQFKWPEKTDGTSNTTRNSGTATEPANTLATSATLAVVSSPQLTRGMKIRTEINGKLGEYRVLRVGEAQARIKSEGDTNAGQITSIPVGHPFEVIEAAAEDPGTEKRAETVTQRRPRNSRSKPQPETQEQVAVKEDEQQPDSDLAFADDTAPEIPADVRAEIDAALNDGVEDENDGEDGSDADERELEQQFENEDNDDHEANFREDIEVANQREEFGNREWITVRELAEHTGLSVGKINKLRKQGFAKSGWRADPDDARRILYHKSLVPKFGKTHEIRTAAKTKATAPATPKPSPTRGGTSGLLTLGQVSEQTGISYPTLVRYVRAHSDRLPSEGEGRMRRFYPEAVDVFRAIRGESSGGRKPGKSTASNTATRKQSHRPRTSRKHAAPDLNTQSDPETAIPTRTRVTAASTSTLQQTISLAIEQCQAQIDQLTELKSHLEKQSESLKLWS